MNPQNVGGIELSRRFYREVVGPLLERRWPDLRHSAALIGSGSEVMGFDDAMSRDHNWGPRLLLFLDRDERNAMEQPIRRYLAETLPASFLGYSTSFSEPDPENHGTRILQDAAGGAVRHFAEIVDIQSYLERYLGVADWLALDAYDWLTLPEQKLRSLVSGEVFHDGLRTRKGSTQGAGGGLAEVRRALAWYPRDVWLFRMAAVWTRISQEEHLMGRAGIVGDEVGSALIGGRLVRDLMRLGFLIERTYAPYPKWFGTAFQRLACGPALYPVLLEALRAGGWRSRDAALARAYEAVAVAHNRLGITDPLPEKPKQFFGRPFTVMAIQGFAEAFLDRIDARVLTETMRRSPIGGIDQISDNTDLLEDPAFRSALRGLYR